MKVAIIYGTNREKATVKVVDWLRQGFEDDGHEVSVGKPSKFDALDYDLIVLGSSVYGGKVQDDVIQFVMMNKDVLNEKSLATFIVCKETKTPEINMEQILCLLTEDPVQQMFIEGYMFRENNFNRQEQKAKDWVKATLSKLS